MLEFDYQSYRITGIEKFKESKIILGIVNLETMQMIRNTNTFDTVPVRRSIDNERKRQNGHNRHDPQVESDPGRESLHFISNTDVEWLSINYRKERAAKLSPSKRRMILILFQKDMSFFPSLREIRDELIKAQMMKIKYEYANVYTTKTDFEFIKSNYQEKWDLIFEFSNFDELDKPLTSNILSNSNHDITKLLLFLYSMESFIYADMNKASREKDRSKIKYYGAFAAALSYIIYYANKNRKQNKLKGKTTLYRGLKLYQHDLDAYIEG